MRQTCLIGLGLLMILGGSFFTSGCTETVINDKMPITTSSEKALDNYLKGRDLLEKLRAQESREYFQEAVREDPDFAVAYLQLAGVQPSAKAFFESFNKARELVDKVSKAERLWILGFEAGNINGDPMRQREMFQQLVDSFPNDERAHSLLAGNYFGQQEWQQAVEEYEKAAAINPDFSTLYNQMGYAYRFLEQYDKAEAAFKKYIELIPNDPNPYDSYAELLMKLGRFDESIEQYRKALEIRPDFVASHIGIASDLNFKGEHAKAREELMHFYDEAKDNGQRRNALNAIALSYLDEGNVDKAVENYQKQYAIAESISDTAAMAGDLAIMGFAVIEVKGREKEALNLFERAHAMIQASSLSEGTKDQNDLGFQYNAARAYIAMGDIENAKKYAREYRTRVLAVKNSNQVKAAHQLYGLIALMEGDYDPAIKELMKSNIQNPYNFYYLAKAYEGMGDKTAAKEYYEKAANFNAINNSPQAAIRLKAAKRAAEF